ncbi:MAG: hypothetical protein U0176_24425 [Bacteroidia bacterium]
MKKTFDRLKMNMVGMPLFTTRNYDDRMDYYEFQDELLAWRDFKRTYAGRHLRNIRHFRGGIIKTAGAVTAIVRKKYQYAD